MADYIDINFGDTTNFSQSMGDRTLKLPYIVETFLASFSSLSAIFVLFMERSNKYLKAVALQTIVLFVAFFIMSAPFFIFCVLIGHFFETVYLMLVIIYFALKVLLIGVAIKYSDRETFVSIPGLATYIYDTASRM